ncbi:MAG: ribosome biogenesis GTP-binding protein YihA/YsxC [Clostridia bacterium]
MIIKSAEYELTAVKPEQYPEDGLPEVAFTGRSNVGKSSMINALCERKGIARTGSTPGKTRKINFYLVNGALRLVDLPGYGYAKVSKAEKKSWQQLLDRYIRGRSRLGLIVQLMDIRHAPSAQDVAMVEWLKGSGIPFAICAVKSDKLPRSRQMQQMKDIIRPLELSMDTPVVLFSALKRQGTAELWNVIEDTVMKGNDGNEIL